jgi:hypothetical protein
VHPLIDEEECTHLRHTERGPWRGTESRHLAGATRAGLEESPRPRDVSAMKVRRSEG